MPPNGTKNLKPISSRTREEARALGIKGGIASGVARRKNKTIKEMLSKIMQSAAPKDAVEIFTKVFGLDPEDITNADAMIYSQVHKAIHKHDTAAFNAVFDRAFGKSIQNINFNADHDDDEFNSIIQTLGGFKSTSKVSDEDGFKSNENSKRKSKKTSD